jgi:hypothetical protein
MLKQVIILFIISALPVTVHAVTYDDILVHKASASRPFWGDHYEYKNIEWISHEPYFKGLDEEQLKGLAEEAVYAVDERGQIDIGKVDFNSDGKDAYIKAMWTAYGGPARGLVIEVYQDEALTDKIATISPQSEGYNPNFQIEDIDGDGLLELITFAGIMDDHTGNAMDENFQGRFSNMRLQVSIYKFMDYNLKLDKRYVTDNRYEPYYVPISNDLPN